MAVPRALKDIVNALAETARDEKVVAPVLRDASLVGDILAQDPHLAVDLQEGSVPLHERRKVLAHVLEDAVHPLVLNATLILQEQDMLDVMPAFLASLKSRLDELAGYHEAAVHTAVPLTAEEKRRLREILESKLGGTVEMTEHVDPSVVGGLQVSAGDRLIDTSIKGRLERLTRALYV